MRFGLIECLIVRLVGWFVGLLAGLLVGQLVGRSVGRVGVVCRGVSHLLVRVF